MKDVHFNPYVHDYSQDYFTTVALESGVVSFNILKTMGTDMITSISYSTDNGETWIATNNVNNKEENITIDVLVNEGDKVLWQGDAQQLGFYDEDDAGDIVGSFFSSTCEFNAEGNVMSLLYGDNFQGQTSLTGKDYSFAWLFSDYDIVSAENLSLPATTLSEGCYQAMFHGCTSLTKAPQLPATTLDESCYAYMFESCTSLTAAPQLPATTLADNCYCAMFYGCTSLSTGPELPAITLASSCYNAMFASCINLTTAPELPATTLAESCYNAMFAGCTSLTTAPELPATTLAESCYQAMFYGCTSLSTITCLATDISAAACTTDWVNGVASSGTFTKAASMTSWKTGVNGIPSGWTIINQ